MPSTRPVTRKIKLRPREDHGFFGPDSPTWKVWNSPTAIVAFLRSIVVESFDPFLAAAVDEQNGVRYDGPGRFDRTISYFLTVAVGDSRTALEASDLLMKVHAKATGIEPLSGKPYSANDPETQLWIHVTGWHSNLLCYERFGPGPLSAAEEKRFWAESAIAAELQTCDPADVPRSREEVREYYARVRPQLRMSPHAKELIRYFLRTPFSRNAAGLWFGSRLMSAAVIATIPKWMREMGDFDHSFALDKAIVPAAKAAVRASSSDAAKLMVLQRMAPSAVPVMRQVLFEKPRLDTTTTPGEARARLLAAS